VSDPKRRAGERHETYVERLIREAQEEGAFEGLSGAGKRLPLTGGELPEAWWIKEKLRREKLSDLPEAIAIRFEAESLAASLAHEWDERVVRERLDEMNAKIRKLNATHVVGPPTTLAPFDVEAFVRRWREGR
jgi:DnaJ homologue, subfamily C, member 28, conserved domain